MYDLVFVEPGPLPPHERTWRHPSELGPTRLDIDTGDSSRHRTTIALATGTLAVMFVAAMVVAITPRSSSSPLALEATTIPSLSAIAVTAATATAAPAIARATDPSDHDRGNPRTPVQLASFVAIPNAVASSPQMSLDGRGIATSRPSPTDIVYVRAEAVTYEVAWADVPLLRIPDGSVVVDQSGDLVARVSRGWLSILAGE